LLFGDIFAVPNGVLPLGCLTASITTIGLPSPTASADKKNLGTPPA